MMSDDQDITIVQRCLTGDPESYATIIERYQRVIYNTSLRMVRDSDDARELTQRVFVKAYENLNSFNPQHKFYSWLYRICVNETLSYIKNRDRFQRFEENMVETEGSADVQTENNLLRHTIQDALMHLTPDYRMVLILRHYHDLSYQEIATTLEIPEKTVKSRLFSARQEMKDLLQRRGVMS